MPIAADALTQWITGTEPHTAFLDVSYCSPRDRVVPRHDTLSLCKTDAGLEAVSLEPTPGRVTVHEKRPTKAKQSTNPTPQGKFVYDMAADLRKNHGMTWQRAISMAEQVWKNTSKSDIKAIHDAEKPDARGEVTEDGHVIASEEDDELEILTTDVIPPVR
jgi:hypothetical protein